ncbi:hypothetical protein THF5H11_70066 [Vibrio jasicida]|uniref:Uncharacterized protein n=1 Tax=Vibrio jasicida TaxID=766224 RepID=A0AAU9QG07_9VIBR|nr:hypothetical protein THF5H11_70066 [Vibrio jasicida]CAH1562133.1 hypothetical protein THF1C08_120099 [Vibrio jasicida]CAH1570963.1 hypothetical protein THF1A12_110065 [Vibrio jasicida]
MMVGTERLNIVKNWFLLCICVVFIGNNNELIEYAEHCHENVPREMIVISSECYSTCGVMHCLKWFAGV